MPFELSDSAGDCQRFDQEVQELLDNRQALTLSHWAKEHQSRCSSCDRFLAIFSQLQADDLPSKHGSADFGSGDLSEVTAGRNDRLRVAISQAISYSDLQAAQTHAENHPDLKILSHKAGRSAVDSADAGNVAQSPRRGYGGRMTMSAWAAAAAVLLTAGGSFWMAGAWNHWAGDHWAGDPVQTAANLAAKDRSNGNLAANSTDKIVVEADRAELGGSEFALKNRRPDAPLADGPVARGSAADATALDINQLTRDWDQSVVAFDQQWQQLAASRASAHQIPGIQPAVYPITGAVEAFRSNLIARSSNGHPAGLRW